MKTFIFSLAVLVILSCGKDDDLKSCQSDFLIFGHSHGECFGEKCVEIFKLTNAKVFEDSNDDRSGMEFKFIQLENDKFELVRHLVDYIPNQLIASNNGKFGCPDCRDQGAIIIKYSKNGNIKNWVIDKSKRDVPEYLHEFIDRVNETISLISD